MADATKPTVEKQPIVAEEEDDDDDMPSLEAKPTAAAAGGEDEDEDDEDDGKDSTMNRAEKKARKAILKLGLKAVPNVARVVVRKGRNTSFVITSPDVYRVPGSDTYCIFGHPDEDSGAGAGGAGGAPAGFPRPGAGSAQDYARTAAQLRQSVAAPSGGDALEESADESGLEAKDIELVVTQAGVSRGKAVAALRKCGGDIVNAIMELTSAA